jgi:hypothetical protein
MSKQIFKTTPPLERLYQLLEDVCEKKDNEFYIVDKCSYKKAMFNDLITPFLQDISPFYHLSKKKYVERKMTFNNFITVVRQICNFHELEYDTKINYDKSKYDIVYFVKITNTICVPG